MNLKTNVWILSKSFFKWTWRRRWYSSTSMSLKVPNINDNLHSFKKLKYPESMFVHCNEVASKLSTYYNTYNRGFIDITMYNFITIFYINTS